VKCYVIEFKKTRNILSQITTFITKQNYSHTGMFFDKHYYELDAWDSYKNEPDYQIKLYKGIKDYLAVNPDKKVTEAFELPHDFKYDDIEKGHKWWISRKDKKYGFGRLFSFLWIVPLRPFFMRRYIVTGKSFKPFLELKGDVCSIAVDKCLKEMGFDAFPEFNERVTYPGLFASKFFKYMV
jgi:hypothetical protein